MNLIQLLDIDEGALQTYINEMHKPILMPDGSVEVVQTRFFIPMQFYFKKEALTEVLKRTNSFACMDAKEIIVEDGRDYIKTMSLKGKFLRIFFWCVRELMLLPLRAFGFKRVPKVSQPYVWGRAWHVINLGIKEDRHHVGPDGKRVECK